MAIRLPLRALPREVFGETASSIRYRRIGFFAWLRLRFTEMTHENEEFTPEIRDPAIGRIVDLSQDRGGLGRTSRCCAKLGCVFIAICCRTT
jgi:hypothetical protein